MSESDLSCHCRTFKESGIGIGLIERDFSGVKNPLKIFALGDIHGSATALNAVEKLLEQAASTNTRVLITGDILDNKTKDSISFHHGAESPHLEIDRVWSIFTKYSSFIDGVVGGNHDSRSFKYSGEDSIRRVCLDRAIPYHPDALVIIYKVGSTRSVKGCLRKDGGPVCYSVFMSHSSRAGRKEGSKLQKVVDFKNVINADVMLAGHSHDLSGCKGGYIDISSYGRLRLKEQVFVNCGSFQEYVGYSVNKNFPPAPSGHATIMLDHEKHKVNFNL